MLPSRLSLALRCRHLQQVQLSSLSCSMLHREQFSSQAFSVNAAPNRNLTCGGRNGTYLMNSALNGLPSQSGEFLCIAGKSFSTSARRSATELSEKGDVVYRGAISGMIRGVKLFSLSTSVIGVCLQPMLLFSNQELPMGIKFVLGGMINFLVFMNPILIHYIAKKYVTELRWNRRTGVFTAATWSFLVQRKEIRFTADDVRVPDVPGMFTFLEAKGVPLFLDPQGFKDNKAYVHMMGFDKPLDWEIPQVREPSAEEDSQKR